MANPTRKEAIESTLRAVGMFLLIVESKRRDHFVNWTQDTTTILDGMRAAIAEALAMPEEAKP